ncbi:MAG: hypothetical protein ABI134_07605 [Byssovorax sp.]
MKRLIAIGFSLALSTTASLALADVPGPTSSATTGAGGAGGSAMASGSVTTGSGTTTAASTTGAGGEGSSGTDGSSGCAAAPGAARGSAALLLGLGMLFAIPLVRRRSGAKK